VAGSTLVYVTSLPDKSCEKVKDGSETLYLCDGVLYRPTYHDDTQVFEVVTPTNEEGAAQADTMLGLSLTSPMTRGPAVRELQTLLVGFDYDVGAVDGVFGRSTEAALLWLQYDYELEQTGAVDEPTAQLLGILPPDETETSDAEKAESDEAEGADAETKDAADAVEEDPEPEAEQADPAPEEDEGKNVEE
jgi:peptidoglycan hydrolase-like protein with peptidoglycan-binding domain